MAKTTVMSSGTTQTALIKMSTRLAPASERTAPFRRYPPSNRGWDSMGQATEEEVKSKAAQLSRRPVQKA